MKDFYKGTFLREKKNRFLCIVLIDGKETECYVPSSCHLSNFLNLENKEVLLIKNKNPKARTIFSLFALPFKDSFIILNSSMANTAVLSNINTVFFDFLGKRDNILKEHVIKDYKSDLFIQETNVIIEIKSLISLDTKALFPTVYSERALLQFDKILYLLQSGYRVCYFIISLNPYIDSIKLNFDSAFGKKIKLCLENKLELKGYSIKIENNNLQILKELAIDCS